MAREIRALVSRSIFAVNGQILENRPIPDSQTSKIDYRGNMPLEGTDPQIFSPDSNR